MKIFLICEIGVRQFEFVCYISKSDRNETRQPSGDNLSHIGLNHLLH